LTGFVVVDPPEVEPLSVTNDPETFSEGTLLYVKVDDETENVLFNGFISAARRIVEARLNRPLITQTLRLDLDAFPYGCRQIELTANLQDEVAVTYIDTNGDEQDFENFVVDTSSTPGRIVLNPDAYWPVTHSIPNAVSITFTAGYGDDPEDVPENLRLAILTLIAHWHENRSAVEVGTIATPIPFTFDALIASEWWGG